MKLSHGFKVEKKASFYLKRYDESNIISVSVKKEEDENVAGNSKMMKISIKIIAALLLIFVFGCKPKKAGVMSAGGAEKSGQQKYHQPQPEDRNIEKKIPDINKPAVVGTETNQPKFEKDFKVDSNNLKIPQTEPNRMQAVEPNVVQNVRGPNEPNEKGDICEIAFYKKCDQILNNYVSRYGKVDFKALKRNRSELRALLDELPRFDPNIYNSWAREDKIAFWINVYNLQMLNIIVSSYPIESNAWSRFFYWPPDDIRYIDKKVGGIEKQKFIVMDEQFSLREIEEKILSNKFNEPAVFFALFHGGLSGPALLNEPYCGKSLQQQLDYQIRRIVSDAQNFKVEPENKAVYLHSILEPSWYGNYFVSRYDTEKDFKDQSAPVRAVFNFLTKYLPQKDISYLKLGNYTVSFVRYNWRLDEQ
jgi:hypothetical protein